MLVGIIKNWSMPDLMRQTPGTSGYWGNIKFTFDVTDKCDVIVVLNYVASPIYVNCSPKNIWVLTQEPYISGMFDWMVEGHKQYSRVFTHHLPHFGKKKYIRCQPAVPWHVNRSYDELKALGIMHKEKNLSWITSNLTVFPGHKTRMSFLEFLKSKKLEMDLYGKGINFIEDKWDGLAPYRYSLAIENSEGPDYWTEKLADCFLAWTVPIYYGCTNLENYFPADSFIRIDINEPEKAYEIIMSELSSDKWLSRIQAVGEARKLVLERYQFFPQIQDLVNRYHSKSPAKKLLLQPYSKQSTLLSKIRRRLSRMTGVA